MRVDDIMRRDVRVCSPGSSLATAGRILADAHCGLLPVLDSDDRVASVITDRDICVALAQRDRKASQVRVSEVASRDVRTCRAEQELHEALAAMREHRVRRLPVIDEAGVLQGILCLSDVIRQVPWTPGSELDGRGLVETLRAIGTRCLPDRLA